MPKKAVFGLLRGIGVLAAIASIHFFQWKLNLECAICVVICGLCWIFLAEE